MAGRHLRASSRSLPENRRLPHRARPIPWAGPSFGVFFTRPIPVRRPVARATHEPARRDRASLVRRRLASLDASIDLIRAEYLTHRFAPHSHEATVIVAVERGTMHTRVGRNAVAVPAGATLVIPGGVVHTGEGATHEGFAYRAMHVPSVVFDSVVRGCTLSFASHVIAEPTLVDRVVHAHERSFHSADARAESALLDVLCTLAQAHGMAGDAASRMREPRLILQVRQYLEAHHARVVTLAELATLTGRSAFHVSRVFREHVGLPPYAYLAQVRVRRALALLEQGHSATTVAHETGFVDQSHLSRHFKRSMGMAPGQYARECGLSHHSGEGRALPLPRLASA